ncbi:hypothetical protein A2U01_0062334, partial [Trifolium medium]|nr:hypothetical protein [Trifolium medium]
TWVTRVTSLLGTIDNKKAISLNPDWTDT